MKILLTALLLSLLPMCASAALKPGFDKHEVRDMIALCNSFTYLELYGDDKAIIPSGYKKIYTSEIHGMDNKFQVYTKGNTGIINLRGSTDKKSSWLENIYSAMIPVEGNIQMNESDFHYKFGTNPKSNVHSGYTLGLAYLKDDLVSQIKSLNRKGIHDIIITGHSQGGALAVLTRAYIHHSLKGELSSKNRFKVYTFAQPMVGNIEFVREYNEEFCDAEMSFSLINPEDKVPHMPTSYNDSTFFQDNLTALISKDEQFNPKKMLADGLTKLFSKPLSRTVTKFGTAVDKQLEKELGKVTLPNPTGDINYSQVGNLSYLPPPEYPLEMKDSSLLNDKEFMERYPRDENGIFLNKSVYKKTTMSQNHKPYNYYTAVLRKYFPARYSVIEPKSFGL